MTPITTRILKRLLCLRRGCIFKNDQPKQYRAAGTTRRAGAGRGSVAPVSVVLLAALLALALSGCANRYEPGSTTALAIEAMALAAQVQDANADRNSPVGGHAARATAYMNTGEGGGGTEESAGGAAGAGASAAAQEAINQVGQGAATRQ